MFLAQFILSVPTAYLMSIFQPQKSIVSGDSDKKKPKNESKDSRNFTSEYIDILKAFQQTFRDAKVVVVFFIIFMIGINSGIIENFNYVLLQQIAVREKTGGDILGHLRLASSLAGGPMFWVSGHIVKHVGVNGVLNMSLFAYILRYITYALSGHVWHALPAELLRGSAFAMFWAGATYYVYGIAPPGLTATMLGLLNGMYGGLGQSLGSLIGGDLSRRFGIERTFLYCAAFNMALLVAFLIYQGALHVVPTLRKLIGKQQVKNGVSFNNSSGKLV